MFLFTGGEYPMDWVLFGKCIVNANAPRCI